MVKSYGDSLRHELESGSVVPFIGVYDVFSASIAGKYFNGIFISGFSFAASYYGLPDRGFISWSDIVAFTQRVRTVLPKHHIIVDIDDGYCDPEVACHVVSLLERIGATGIILEDQRRPRRCGHLDGKQLLEIDEFSDKLASVLAVRDDLFVIARTDATDEEEVLRRVDAFHEAGADAILADGIKSLDIIRKMKLRTDRPIMFNQIAGGKSPQCGLSELQAAGVSLVNYSTPCLFAAQEAVEGAMNELGAHDLDLKVLSGTKVDLDACNAWLDRNISLRDEK